MITTHSKRRPAGTRSARLLWLTAGWLSLAAGAVGLLLPLLPTVPFVLLAAYCFSHGSERCERWILEHRHLGPMVQDWRATRAVPLRAKQFASVMMAISAAAAWFVLPLQWAWMPTLGCTAVAIWLWRLPTRGADETARTPPVNH